MTPASVTLGTETTSFIYEVMGGGGADNKPKQPYHTTKGGTPGNLPPSIYPPLSLGTPSRKSLHFAGKGTQHAIERNPHSPPPPPKVDKWLLLQRTYIHKSDVTQCLLLLVFFSWKDRKVSHVGITLLLTRPTPPTVLGGGQKRVTDMDPVRHNKPRARPSDPPP